MEQQITITCPNCGDKRSHALPVRFDRFCKLLKCDKWWMDNPEKSPSGGCDLLFVVRYSFDAVNVKTFKIDGLDIKA